MDAISHLISDDPVSKERQELRRIKAAVKGKEQETEVGKQTEANVGKEGSKKSVPTAAANTSSPEPMSSEDAERIVADDIWIPPAPLVGVRPPKTAHSLVPGLTLQRVPMFVGRK
jgi:hypothetical protein